MARKAAIRVVEMRNAQQSGPERGNMQKDCEQLRQPENNADSLGPSSGHRLSHRLEFLFRTLPFSWFEGLALVAHPPCFSQFETHVSNSNQPRRQLKWSSKPYCFRQNHDKNVKWYLGNLLQHFKPALSVGLRVVV